jgi:PPOX class probable F420-dependent enzyme
MGQLPDRARAMLEGRNFATIATVQPGGEPQTTLVWAKADGDDVLFSTIKGRQKFANLSRDPRVSVLVADAADPYRYAEIRGTATMTDDPAAELIDELSRKYTGEPFGERPGEQRVIVRVTPRRVILYGD